MYRKPGNEPDASALDGILKFESNNSETVELKIGQMNSQIKNLEKSIGELQARVKAYHDIILKYESALREEILLYRLQKTKLTTIQEAFQNQELFAKEIEQHITSYVNNSHSQSHTISTFKRIISRFFHQNKLNQCNANVKISEIQELLDKKQQLLERFQTEVKNWNKNLSIAISAKDRQQIALN
jgi:chromosome segregation ATPase